MPLSEKEKNEHQNSKLKEHLLEAIEAPTAANTKKNVEMNSARYDLSASGFTECSNREVSDAIFEQDVEDTA